MYIATPSLRSLFSGKLILSFLMISRFCEAVWPHIQRTIASSPRMIPAHRVPTASVELRALDVLVISHPGHYRNFRLHHHHPSTKMGSRKPGWASGGSDGSLTYIQVRSGSDITTAHTIMCFPAQIRTAAFQVTRRTVGVDGRRCSLAKFTLARRSLLPSFGSAHICHASIPEPGGREALVRRRGGIHPPSYAFNHGIAATIALPLGTAQLVPRLFAVTNFRPMRRNGLRKRWTCLARGELRPTPDLRVRQTVSDPFQLVALIRRTGTHCCLSTSYLPLARPCTLHWHNESGVPFFFFFSFFFFSAVHQWTEVITALSGRHVQPLWRSSKWPAACRSPPPT